MEITRFKNIFQQSDGELSSIDEFLNQVKFGQWKEVCESIKNESDKAKRQELKKFVPYVTISGTFEKRNINGLNKHSGFICMDFDDMDDIQKALEDLQKDEFVYATFRSISGKGLAALVKIKPHKHKDAFLALEAYFAEKYGLFVDTSCKDVSRARFVSYDPDLFVNRESKVFEKYLPKEQTKINPKRIPHVVTGQNDVDFLIEQIRQHGVDLTQDSYFIWLRLGFAIAEEHGESGRDLFHAVSENATKYNSDKCDKQFNHCLKAKQSGVNYGTLLYYAKEAGLSILSPETKHISTVAAMTKKSGRGLGDAIRVLVEVDGIDEKTATEVSEKVFARDDLSAENVLSKLESIEILLNANYNLKRNEITKFVEENGEEIDTNFLNSVYIRARKEIDDKVKFEEIDRLIGSEFTPNYNPLKEFIERNKNRDVSGNLDKLAECLESDTGVGSDYKARMLKKWFVGIIATIFDKHSPLLLVLTGGQGTGKTYFFRHLLPKEIRGYYAESKLDAGKDDEILMTQKILILDDEFGGKSKLEAKRLKELTSKEFFTLREPYGRKNVRLRRLAVLCGTSNDTSILNDPTGNRRIVPINILNINHELFNSIDKTDLFIEAFKLYESGFSYETTKEEIQLLNNSTAEFEQIRPEQELILRYFRQPVEGESGELFTVMDIKAHIEQASGQRLIVQKILFEMKALKFMKAAEDCGGAKRVGFRVMKRNIYSGVSPQSTAFPI